MMVMVMNQLQPRWTRIRRVFTSLGLLVSVLFVGPAWAQDPFRIGDDARDISPEVAEAFAEFFCAGRYTGSREKLDAALAVSPDEPIVYALLAALAYQEGDLAEFSQRGQQTLDVAQALEATDPLRGNLYKGVGYGFAAANIVLEDGVVMGLPKALPTLNNLFGSIREAQAIDAEDPELNLLNGYMDLLLTNRDKALTQFRKAGPEYMSQRGIALAYRDLDDYPAALAAVDRAIEQSCDNPELYYLKAQILANQGNDGEAVILFDQALDASDQLPSALVEQIQRERNSAYDRSIASN